ncbi:universal stress protein [Streptomyces sp. NPDC048389]|uniref:universal stress protein n=1 Tax=Streptomyces sp. NPDC048389 TaxID=3154622 RepID=UPI00345154B6
MSRAIVTGVDGSAESLAAANWAGVEAERRGLPLRLLHAWLWQPVDVPLVQDRETQARSAEAVLREAATMVTRRHPELAVTSQIVADTPVPALLDAAAEAEMLVIGSRGHGRLVGFLLGSYGQQVIASATRPVVAVREPAQDDRGRGTGEVVVGQQGSADESGAVLGFAFGAAAARGATVRAVRAWEVPPAYTYGSGTIRLTDGTGGLQPYEKQALAEALEPWRERYPGVPVVEHVEVGSAGPVLLSASSDADLLVVGRRVRRSTIGARIGSVAHAALHHAPCPVAVVPHD